MTDNNKMLNISKYVATTWWKAAHRHLTAATPLPESGIPRVIEPYEHL